MLLRTRPLIGRPAIPRDLAGRVHVRTARDGERARAILDRAAIFVPGVAGSRARRSRRPQPVARSPPSGIEAQPELAAAAAAAPRRGRGFRAREGRRARAAPRSRRSPPSRRELDEIYTSLHAPADTRRRPSRSPTAPWIVADLHMHTSWSHDCRIDPAELVDHAEAEGLGAIAVTDHNVFGGALEAVDCARGRDLIVIPGEEVKTDGQGEVIGLFLSRRSHGGCQLRRHGRGDPRAGRARLRPAPVRSPARDPRPATLHRHLADIDVLEVYNARLLFEAFNDEALRFARKYDLTMGAGSDATCCKASAPEPCECGRSATPRSS